MDKIPPPSKLTRQVAMSVFASNFRGKVKLAQLYPPPSKLTRQVANK